MMTVNRRSANWMTSRRQLDLRIVRVVSKEALRMPMVPAWKDPHSAIAAAILGVLVAIAAWGSLNLVGRPADSLVTDVVVDDAFYYVRTAQNFWAGKGYSFDGEERSNGVQPLWAVIVLALVRVVPDSIALARIMSLISALCWFGAGFVLYQALRRWDTWAALFFVVGWTMAAFVSRIAFQGMENGLHALLLAFMIALCVRWLGNTEDERHAGRFYFQLGLLLALFTLARVDSGLLALLIGLAVWLGLIRADGPPRLGLNWGPAVLLALPGVFLVGTCLLINHYYFGSAAPISGRVKLFYCGKWDYAHGDLWSSLAFHFRLLADLALAGFPGNLERGLYKAFRLSLPSERTRLVLLALIGIAAAAAVVRALSATRRSRLSNLSVFAMVLSLFVLVRTTTYAVKLSNFTPYCIWYFAPEIMLFWLGTMLALRAAVRPATARDQVPQASRPTPLANGLLGAATLVLLAVQASSLSTPPQPDPRTNAFLNGGRWLNEKLPAGRRIGAFSAGIVGTLADKHQVFNLDGLINSRRYFENYIRSGRYRQYAADNRLEFLADYAPAAKWRGFWGFTPDDMELVRSWTMPGGLRYCVWRMGPLGSKREILDPCAGFCDRLSQIRFVAEVDRKYPLIGEDDLAQQLAAGGDDMRVVCSIAETPNAPLQHVLMRRPEIESLHLRPADADIQYRSSLVYGQQLRLLGCELLNSSAKRGGAFVVTFFWERLAAESDLAGAVIEAWLSPSDPQQLEQTPTEHRILYQSKGCYGTYPLDQWQLGELVVETWKIGVPRNAPRGAYPINLGVWSPKNGWLTPNIPSTPGAATGLAANVTVE